MVSRVAHDEVSAINGLRGLTSLETRYATAHPSKGFTCDFALLKTEVPSNRDPPTMGFCFLTRLRVTNFRLLDARPTRKSWSSDIRQALYLCCPAKQEFVLSAQTKQANFVLA